MHLLQLHSILLATDLSPGSSAAEATAVKLAAAAGAKLSVIHAMPPDASDATGEERLQRAKAIAAPSVRARVRVVRVLHGSIEDTVLTEQSTVDADTVVLGPRRKDAPDPGPLGSVAYAVVRRAHVPTLIVPRELPLPLTRVMVAVDLTTGGRRALAAALTWASALRHPKGSAERTTLVAVHVDVPNHPRRLCAEDGERLRKEVELASRQAASWGDVDTQFLCIEGKRMAETILDRQLSDDADLLVIGTHANIRAPNDSLGSVSDTVTRWATRPVLLVPPTMAVSPPMAKTARRSRLRA